MARADLRVAIDIGGMFVDAISYDPADNSVRTWKSPTTPGRAPQCVRQSGARRCIQRPGRARQRERR